ncbi:unnamed protein product [Phytophthora fragariaefolia]|uniref:Unnamed protein product n=1 Tax=Phytophthora fragariaefolia TaxID=1490495 RepID=A0A9W6TUP2_9STRA|nr:unnamed protein product [Phytophthora fragariaefolia]
MHLSAALFGVISMMSVSFAAKPGYRQLPWDGRAYNLTIETLDTKYNTAFLNLRNGRNDGNPADYITVQHQGRPEGYNDDGGVLAIGVDGNAIFSTNTEFRRSDVFQSIEGTSDTTTFYRASFMKGEAFLNAYDWLLIFLGSGVFEIGVDASKNPALVYYRNNGTDVPKWSIEFVPGTCTGQDELKFNSRSEVEGSLLTLNEFHIGPSTYFSEGSVIAMNEKQDVVSFNGMSVEATAIGAGAPTPAPSEGGVAVSGSAEGEARTFTFNDRK